MKNLEVLGVREMDAVEMKNENGGGLLVAALVTMLIAEVILNPQAHIEAFKEGWNEAKK